MKIIKTKLLQKNKGKRKGKYRIELEVTDYDIEKLEDVVWSDLESIKKDNPQGYEKIRKWMENKLFKCFWKLWYRYGEYY